MVAWVVHWDPASLVQAAYRVPRTAVGVHQNAVGDIPVVVVHRVLAVGTCAWEAGTPLAHAAVDEVGDAFGCDVEEGTCWDGPFRRHAEGVP